MALDPLGIIDSLSKLAVLVASCVGLFGGSYSAWRESQRQDVRITESRQRVRAAERDLEAALRGAQDPEIAGRIEDHADETAPTGVGALVANERMLPAPRLTLPELWTLTHSRLDLYHDIATGQARRSFRNAQVAMFAGFILLVVFVAVALKASTTAGSIVAGGLGAVSAALAGFVSRTFVKSQETSAAHLRAYFDQPLEFSRYLAAERLVADSALTAEQRAEVLMAMVQTIVAPPGGLVAPNRGDEQQPEA
ncbi:TRADD-N-associated membrane domain-containing protein [Streptomyces griseorubiginosus]|uniref:TRADD-N-associated membrane domain-containing protein n=1 Tax=Streptomyces griseorubiginosus TaxID=67304 RepID=UPI0033243E08